MPKAISRHLTSLLRGEMRNIISLIFVGFGTGWLAGLSVSPVVSTIIAGLLGLASVAIAALSGLEGYSAEGSETHNVISKPEVPLAPPANSLHIPSMPRRITLIPMAVFTASVGFGEPLGIYARTAEWFAPKDALLSLRDLQRDLLSLGLSQRAIADVVVKSYSPIKSDDHSDMLGGAFTSPPAGALFTEPNLNSSLRPPITYCDIVRYASPTEYRDILSRYGSEFEAATSEVIKSDDDLRQIVKKRCQDRSP